VIIEPHHERLEAVRGDAALQPLGDALHSFARPAGALDDERLLDRRPHRIIVHAPA
jgi:hypothetical protein